MTSKPPSDEELLAGWNMVTGGAFGRAVPGAAQPTDAGAALYYATQLVRNAVDRHAVTVKALIASNEKSAKAGTLLAWGTFGLGVVGAALTAVMAWATWIQAFRR